IWLLFYRLKYKHQRKVCRRSQMEMPTWSFLVIAIIMAVVIGRAGTLLREHLNRVNLSKVKRQRMQRSSISQ
ncbi:hypothetical protein APC50_09190, partial [Acinetobacter baumannii]